MTSISSDELRALVARIKASGVLGRSRTYAAILDYLMESAISGDQPKEVAIAVDVLGRDSDFDVGKDSIVRVQLYHLRNKLQAYFDTSGQAEPWRLEIPKGQYLLVATANESEPTGARGEAPPLPSSRPWLPWLAGMLAALLLITLFLPRVDNFRQSPLNQARSLEPWEAIIDDDSAILVIVGDYFIFGELDAQGNVTRMVRDFGINSDDELAALMMLQPEYYERYYDLGLSYLPVGAAPALASLMPLLYEESDRVTVRTMSELGASDLTGNHIIYVGYLSGLGVLEDFVFASSDWRPGTTWDELLDGQGNEYVSSSGILNMGAEFHDYGLVSAFMSPKGHRFLVVAGMRDAALVSMAEKITDAGGLQEALEASGNSRSWEALYEVYGLDHTSFDATLVRAHALDERMIWGRQPDSP